MQGTSSASRRAGRLGACALLIGAALLAACDNGPKTAATITLSVPSTNLVVGQHVTITPTVKDADGKVLIGRTVQYTSSAPTVVNVTSEGEIVALNPGSGTITATVEAATANLGIVVAPVPVSRVLVTPDTATFAAATTKQLTATALDSAGNTLFDRTVTWSVSDASVASVNAGGLVNGLKEGSVTVTATIEGKTGQARLTLTQAAVSSIQVSPSTSRIDEGNSFRLTAVARDANNRVITNPKLNWRSTAPAIATVDSTGLVTGVAPGQTNIIVTSASGAFGGGIVLVAAVVTGSVAITQDSARIDIGATTQLTVTVRDTLGNVINRPVSWLSLDNNIATVSSTGLVTGVGLGDVSIIASREGKADTAIIHVNPPQAASVTISPAAADLAVGKSGRFNATARDSAGDPLPRPLTWSSADQNIATIDASTGLITAQATGTTTIFVESNGKFASARLDVVTTPVATLIPTTTLLTLSPGATGQLGATVKDASNNVLSNRLISFEGSSVVATVDETGVVKALSPGAAIVSVSCEGITALVQVTVQ